jgi:hypothetical protein
VKISKHASVRLRERTKLKESEFQIILDKVAFVELQVFGQKQYILFYDARGDEFFVAVIGNNCVMSVIHLWQRLHTNVKSLATAQKVQNNAEMLFYMRAARDLHPKLQARLQVYVSFEGANSQVLVQEELVHCIDRAGYEPCKPMMVIECFAEEISRLLVREMASSNSNWIVCVTFRRLNGQIVKKYSSRIGKIVNLLPCVT